ncbi:hypothetical protein HHK36_013192 [Tetracentron sinense]|uniref:non-specific serine/threonine protein kinase n=1 Tax=Tetracentron sinense TaxID=13715 RepID=A0A834ZA87_TETSI|nr:hypothetical protein HHK36_013192 [Tetracentron sinense]
MGGKIPGQLGNCKKLKVLNLSFNSLSVPLPGDLVGLESINSLWASAAAYSSVLIILDVSSNLLSGEIPQERLQLDNNLFEGTIPSSIGQLKHLTNLLLHGNQLSGGIPLELFNCSELVSLDLGGNRLTGPILKSISRLELLDNLVLSKNQLSGLIPDEICSGFWKVPLPDSEFIQHYGMLDLSYNEAESGPIPFSGTNVGVSSLLFLNASNCLLCLTLSNLTTLSTLDLHNNSFTGRLPLSLSNLAALTYPDVSDNNFQESVPCDICSILGLAFVNFSGNRFKGYMPETCTVAHPCRACHSIFPSLRGYPPPLALTRVSVWGIALGVTLFFQVLLIGLLRWKKFRREVLSLAAVKGKPMTTIEPASTDELLGKKPKEPLSFNIATFEHSLLPLNAADILSATDNFSKTHIIGDGGFGTVYRALLPEGRTIAVKRLNGGHFQFLAEMETIGKVKHKNLVPLLGYCVFGDETFLIYEYMENGSLDVWLRNRADAVEALDNPVGHSFALKWPVYMTFPAQLTFSILTEIRGRIVEELGGKPRYMTSNRGILVKGYGLTAWVLPKLPLVKPKQDGAVGIPGTSRADLQYSLSLSFHFVDFSLLAYLQVPNFTSPDYRIKLGSSSKHNNQIAMRAPNYYHEERVINQPPEKRQDKSSSSKSPIVCKYFREEIQRIKANNPGISHREAFSTAAKNWAHFPCINFGLMLETNNLAKLGELEMR